MSEPFEEMDALRGRMINILADLAAAARAVVRSDGTDRVSIEELRTALYAYNEWLGEDEA